VPWLRCQKIADLDRVLGSGVIQLYAGKCKPSVDRAWKVGKICKLSCCKIPFFTRGRVSHFQRHLVVTLPTTSLSSSERMHTRICWSTKYSRSDIIGFKIGVESWFHINSTTPGTGWSIRDPRILFTLPEELEMIKITSENKDCMHQRWSRINKSWIKQTISINKI